MYVVLPFPLHQMPMDTYIDSTGLFSNHTNEIHFYKLSFDLLCNSKTQCNLSTFIHKMVK